MKIADIADRAQKTNTLQLYAFVDVFVFLNDSLTIYCTCILQMEPNGKEEIGP